MSKINIIKSNWCDSSKWYKNAEFTKPHKTIPINEVNDIIVESINLKIDDITCFTKIPSIESSNINIEIDSTTNDNYTYTFGQKKFTCENLKTSTLTVGPGVTLTHWEPGEFCYYEAETILSTGNVFMASLVIDTDQFNFNCSGSPTEMTFGGKGSIFNCKINTNSFCICGGFASDQPAIIDCDITALSGTINCDSWIARTNLTVNKCDVILGNFRERVTGVGDFSFYNGSYFDGTIYGNVLFDRGSSNRGTVVGSAIFSTGSFFSKSYNFGTVTGNCIFYDQAENWGNIIGNAHFINSINRGTISGDVIFETTGQPWQRGGYDFTTNQSIIATNYGIISGITTFKNATNRGVLLSDATFTSPYNSYDSQSVNYGSISGDNSITFINSINSGLIISSGDFFRQHTNFEGVQSLAQQLIEEGNPFVIVDIEQKYGPYVGKGCSVSFLSAVNPINSDDQLYIGSRNYGTIRTEGEIIFKNSENYFPIKSPNIAFNQRSINNNNGGLTSQNISFTQDSENYGKIRALISKDFFFIGRKTDNIEGIPSNRQPFLLEAIEYDVPHLFTQDYTSGNYVSNFFDQETIPNIHWYKWLRENLDSFNCQFTNSTNFGDQVVKASFNNAVNANEGRIVGQAFFYSSRNAGSVYSGAFYKQSYNLSYAQAVINQASFFDTSANSGLTGLIYGRFNDKSYNHGWSENASYYDNSQNYGRGEYASFYDKSRNGIYLSFNNNQLIGGYGNDNPILVGAIFNDSSINCHYYVNQMGDVVYNPNVIVAQFHDNSINYGSGGSGVNGNFGFDFYDKSSNEGFCLKANFNNSAVNKNYVKDGIFLNNSRNKKSGSGYALFFGDNSQNDGYSIAAAFVGSSINGPTAYSSFASFEENSTNNSSFSVTNRPTLSGIDLYKDYPNIIFLDNSKNIGNIVESLVSFWDNSSNLGSIRFGTNYTFNENRILKKELLDNEIVSVPLAGVGGNISSDTYDFLNIFYGCSSFQWPTLSFRNNSKNSGNLAGYFKYYFYDSSENYASVSSFPVVPELHDVADFHGTNINFAPCKNFGTIPGKSSFISCINSGTVQYPSFSSSINYGNIIGEATNDININILCKQTIPGFNKISFLNSKNYGNARINCDFTNSYNYGNIAKNATLNNSTNFGFIGGDVIFSNSYNYGDIGSNASFFSSPCACCNIRGTAKFDYYSDYYSYSYLSNLVSMPYDPLAPYTLQFIINNLLTAYAPNNSIQQILASLRFKAQNISKSAEFINFSNNYGGLLSEDAYFSDTSKNRGTIQGNAIFTRDSHNYGNVSKNATFSVRSNNYFADIGGDAVFESGCDNIFGNIGRNATFTNTTNRGNIGNSGFFFDSTHYGNIGKGAIFDDSVFMVGTAQNVAFLNRSINEKYGHIKVSAVFDNLSENRGHIGGNALFTNDSSNIAVRQSFFGTFIGYSPAGYVEGDAIFLSGPEAIRNSNGSTTSDNYGVIGGSATFDSSIADNCGYVFGSILSDTNIGCSSFYSMNRQEALDIIDTYNSLEYRNIVENWQERAAQSMQ